MFNATAVVLALLLAAQDGGAGTDGGVSDRPVVTRLSSGDFLFSPAAVKAVDTEMKRLQAVEAAIEADKKAAQAAKESEPSWVPVVLISALTGLAVGAGLGLALGIPLGRVSAGK